MVIPTYKSDTGSITGFHPIFIGMKLKMIDAKRYAQLHLLFVAKVLTMFLLKILEPK